MTNRAFPSRFSCKKVKVDRYKNRRIEKHALFIRSVYKDTGWFGITIIAFVDQPIKIM